MSNVPLLSGCLEFIPLADLFQILGGSNCTGVLLISGDFSPCRGEIHFLAGEPVDAAWGSYRGIEAVYALFGWRQGRFEFFPQGFSGNRSLRKSRMEIILDALRRLDDGLIKRIGTPQRSTRDLRWSDHGTEDDLPTVTGSIIDYDYILSEERFQPGTRIVSEGSYGNWIWMIVDGSALVSRETGGTSTPLLHLGEGAFIGSFEVLLFGDHIRSATVTAEGDMHSALLDTHRLSTELMGISPRFRKYLLEMSARAKEAMYDLSQVLRRSERRAVSGPASTWTSNLNPAYERETLALEKYQEEYALLSRTFKSFIQCTASTIATMSTMASEIRGSSNVSMQGGLHLDQA